MNYENTIAQNLHLRQHSVAEAINLLDAGNTIPFIARYRKERTDNLDEEQLRQILSSLEHLRSIDKRRESILSSIDEQGKLTDHLRQQILAVDNISALEDLYQPYRPKRQTRASMARDRGLEGLAHRILKQPISHETPEKEAEGYLNQEVPSVEEALSGARDIVAEMISDHSDIRSQIRGKAVLNGMLCCEKIQKAVDNQQTYQVYYEFNSRIDRIKPYQVLAVNRGEKEKILRIRLDLPESAWRPVITRYFQSDPRSKYFEQLNLTITDAADRLLLPAIERDIRHDLTDRADKHAIKVFSTNLRALLLQPPMISRCVLGLDPGFRTGCKVAVVDQFGKMLVTATIYPHEPRKNWKESQEVIINLVDKFEVTLIAIGNGTASRETEKLVAEITKDRKNLYYLIVNEAGASVYSASPLAREEFPDMDVSLRGAVSIARRAQDPLAELVKIDPKSIGVGLYQHDVDQKELDLALASVVESAVNQVGVDVNTASPALLGYVAGIGPKLADKIFRYREENGPFTNRGQLKKVNSLGAKVFEQAAGFLRINHGDNPFDASAIHPESYLAAQAVLKMARIKMESDADVKAAAINELMKSQAQAEMAKELQVGLPTLLDILEQLIRPGRDPRQEMPAPILRSDVLSMEDLATGMAMKGTVRNVVDFGAFVDIGVKTDGLLHRSQFPVGISLQVGDVIDITILSVEIDRGRIGLKWAGSI